MKMINNSKTKHIENIYTYIYIYTYIHIYIYNIYIYIYILNKICVATTLK